MAIDIGAAALVRATNCPEGYTFISKENPANASGTITLVALWNNSGLTGLKIGIFVKTDTNDFTCRDYADIGDADAGYQEYVVDLDVVAGDYIGFFVNTGAMRRDDSGEGYWYLQSDEMECVDTTFTFSADRTVSLYGTGETAGIEITEVGAIASEEAIGAHQLNLKIEPSAIASVEAFGTTIVGKVISPSGIVSAEAFGTLIVTGPIIASSITSEEAFGTAQLNFTIYPFTILTDEEFGAPLVGGVIVATGIASGEVFGVAIVAGPLTVDGIESEEAFGTAILAGPITPTGIASLEAVGALSVIGASPAPVRLEYILELHDADGTLVAALNEAYNISYTQLLNSPHSLTFAIKGDDSKLSYLTLAREIWLRNFATGQVVRKFKLTERIDSRI